jgi:hypothetical protein
MKRFWKGLLGLFLLAMFVAPAFGASENSPAKNHSGFLGKAGKAWYATYSDYYYLTGGTAFTVKFQGTPTANRTVTWPDKSGTVAMTTDVSTAASAWDDLTSPDAAKTHAMTTFAQTLTSTKTDGDMFNFQGLGAFGDVSVVRIEQKTGNATDGTVLEVVSADTDVDALLVTANSVDVIKVNGAGTLTLTGATGIIGATTITGAGSVSSTLTVAGATTLSSTLAVNGNATIGNNGGTVEINSSDWDISTTGAASGIASIAFDNSLVIYNTTVACNNACIKGLRAAPLTLVAAPGADKFVELVRVTLILNYGSEVLTESADNLVVQYNTSGTDITAAIEMTGFIDANADTIASIYPLTIPTLAAANAVNKAVELFNTGDGEFEGNASNDTTLSVRVAYRVHTAGL